MVFKRGKFNPRSKAFRQLGDSLMKSSEERAGGDTINGLEKAGEHDADAIPDLQMLLDDTLDINASNYVTVADEVAVEGSRNERVSREGRGPGVSSPVMLLGSDATDGQFSSVDCQQATFSVSASAIIGTVASNKSEASSGLLSDSSPLCTPVISTGSSFHGSTELKKSAVISSQILSPSAADRTHDSADDFRTKRLHNILTTPVTFEERDLSCSGSSNVSTSAKLCSLDLRLSNKYNEGSVLFVSNYRKRKRKSASSKKRVKRTGNKSDYSVSGENRLSCFRKRCQSDELFAKKLAEKARERFNSARRRIRNINRKRYMLDSPYRQATKKRASFNIKEKYTQSSPFRRLTTKRAMERYSDVSKSPRRLHRRRLVQKTRKNIANDRKRTVLMSATFRKSQEVVAAAKECLGKRRKIGGNLDFLLRRREQMRKLDGIPRLAPLEKGSAEAKKNRYDRWKRVKVRELVQQCVGPNNGSGEEQENNSTEIEDAVNRMFRQLLNYQREQMKEFYRCCGKISFIHQSAEAEICDVVPEEINGKLEAYYGKNKYHIRSHEMESTNVDRVDYLPYEEVFPDDVTCRTFNQLQLNVRLCDSDCADQIPPDWPTVLHQRISKVSTQLQVKDLMHNVHMFEHCEKCNLSGQLCASLAFCSDTVSYLLHVQTHYAGIRTLLVDLYKIRRSAMELHMIELLMNNGTYGDFLEFKTERFPDKPMPTVDSNVALGIASEEAVRVQYGTLVALFKDMVRKSMDVNECFHCIRLVDDSNILAFKVEDGLPFLNRSSVKASIQDYEAHFKTTLRTVLVCKVCHKLLSAKVSSPSPYSSRNGMWPCVRPDELRGLNTYERQLISFVKCFQRIVKLSPFRFKGLSNTLARAIKGIAVHLPLPRASLKKVSEVIKGDVVLPDCSSFLIQVDSLPNLKKMTVFRSLVDISAVMEALSWLKQNNFLYKDVKIDRSLMLIPQIIQTTTNNSEADEVETEVSDDLLQSSGTSNVEADAPGCSLQPNVAVNIGIEAPGPLPDASVDNSVSNEVFEVVATKQKAKKLPPSYFDTLKDTASVTDSAVSPSNISSTIVDQSKHKSLPDGLKFHVPYVVPYKKYILEELKDTSSALMHIPQDEVLEEFSVIPMEKSLPKQFDLELFASKPISNTPLSWDDPHLDVACFPHLFCDGQYGLFHQRTRLVTPAYYMEHRLRMSDARFRRDQPYVFDCALRKDMMSINSSVYTLLNTGRFGQLTAGQLQQGCQDPDKSPTLERNVTTMLGTILGTPQYWTRVRRDLEAVIQQYGSATFFLTLSCCEYKCDDFKEFLILRNAEIPNVKNTAVRNLISIDPVSVSLHFHKKFTLFWDRIIMDPDGPLGCVERYYIKKEYQQRGAPHIHALLWVRDAPVHGRDRNEDVLAFITRHITCEIPDQISSPRLHSLVTTHQKHTCTKSCLRSKMVSGKFYCSYCRYGFPRETTTEAHINSAEEVLSSRVSGRRRQKLYSLVRREDEANINDYNPAILTMWEANNDLQYIKDVTMSLAYYTTMYVCKAEKQLMSEVARSVNTNLTAAGMAKQLLCKMLSNRQLGIFEAADKVLRNPLYRMSDQVKCPSIYLPSEQRRRLKTKTAIQSMPEDSTDIFCNSFQNTYYPNRPDDLDKQSAYELTQWYEVRYGQPKKVGGLRIKGANAFFSRRRTAAVVRIWQTKNDDDLSIERYCFQVLALFKPWRCYDDLLKDEQGVTYASYTESLNVLRHSLPALQQHERSKKRFEDMIVWARQVKFDAHARLEAEVDHVEDQALLRSLHNNAVDLDIEMVQQSERIRMSLTEESVTSNYHSLNECQRYAFNLVMDGIKCDSGSFSDRISRIRRVFVSGVGGTGKSFLIMALRQHLEFHHSCKDGPAVLVAAPTGVAAVNIDGVTIHKLLKLPVSKSKKSDNIYWPLHALDSKILRILFRNCKLLIIDEISMLSNLYLTIVHKRLNEILIDEEQDPNARFGNLNILLLGDLLQLPPVKAPHVFVTLTQEDIAINFKAIGEDVNLWRDFEFVELTENMRQRDDALYAQMLDRIRIGSPTSDDLDCLRKRLIYNDQEPMPDWPELLDLAVNKFLELHHNDASVLCLMPKNETVNQFNARVMERLKLQPISCAAEDTIDITSGTAVGKRRSKKKAAEGLTQFQRKSIQQLPVADTGGLEDILKLSVGARVMLRRNIDIKLKLVNGSIGVVRQIDANPDTGKAELIHVDFQDVTGVTVISKVSANYCIGKGLFIQRVQFPLTLSYAITIHKCQGLSLRSVMVDIGQSAFSDGMGYVALSRVKTLNNLHIIRFAPGLLKCNKYCVYEYDRLRKASGIAVASVQFNRNPEIEKWKKSVTVSAASQKRSLEEELEMDDNINEVSKKPRRGKASKLVKKYKKDAFIPTLPIHSGMYVKLSNNDGHSCFANAVVQCLLRCKDMWDPLQRSTDRTPVADALLALRINATQGNGIASTALLREAFHDDIQFHPQSQLDCDPAEFISKLIPKLPDEVAGLFAHEVFPTGECPMISCQQLNAPEDPSTVYVNIGTELQLDKYNIKDIFSDRVVRHFTCQACHCYSERFPFTVNHSFTDGNRYLILNCPVIAGSLVVGKALLGVRVRLLMYGVRWNLIACIQVCGLPEPTRSADQVEYMRDDVTKHYMAYVQHHDNEWILLNDTSYTVFKYRPTMKNMVLLVLERAG